MDTSIIINLVVQMYFSNFWCIYNLADININSSNATFVVKSSVLFAIKANLFESIKCAAFVISSKQPQIELELIEQELRKNTIYKFNSRFYLLVYNETQGDTFDASELFQRKVFATIVNVLVVVKQKEECICLYTHQYMGVLPLDTVFIGKVCTANDIVGFDLYPDKQKNMMGREIVLSTFTFHPYVDLENHSGFELSMINIFIRKHNYTKNYLLFDQYLWGELYDNLTGVGAHMHIYNGHADIGVAGFFASKFDHKVDKSTFTIRTGVTFLVPKPRLDIGPTILVAPFHTLVWFTLLGTLLILVIGLILLNNHKQKYFGPNLYFRLLMLIWCVLLQQPTIMRIKLVACMVITFGMVLLGIFYNCGYSSHMTKPSYLPCISTGKELDESNLPIYVPHRSYLTNLDPVLYPNIYKNFRNAFVDAAELRQILAHATDIAIGIDHANVDTLGAYDSAFDINTLENFGVLKNDMLYDWCIFPAYKNSVIIPVLNKFIDQIKAAGLQNYYFDEAIRGLEYKKRIYMQNIRYRDVSFTHYFDINTLSGAFVMRIVGLLLAACTFIFELKKNPSKCK